ncbi:MAG: hypothetical protein ACRDNJ_03310 [Solirubrobacteraceae bacterium]
MDIDRDILMVTSRIGRMPGGGGARPARRHRARALWRTLGRSRAGRPVARASPGSEPVVGTAGRTDLVAYADPLAYLELEFAVGFTHEECRP